MALDKDSPLFGSGAKQCRHIVILPLQKKGRIKYTSDSTVYM